jgi:hypothetical protein
MICIKFRIEKADKTLSAYSNFGENLAEMKDTYQENLRKLGRYERHITKTCENWA